MLYEYIIQARTIKFVNWQSTPYLIAVYPAIHRPKKKQKYIRYLKQEATLFHVMRIRWTRELTLWLLCSGRDSIPNKTLSSTLDHQYAVTRPCHMSRPQLKIVEMSYTTGHYLIRPIIKHPRVATVRIRCQTSSRKRLVEANLHNHQII